VDDFRTMDDITFSIECHSRLIIHTQDSQMKTWINESN
jgi:hypothetical protein